MTLSCCISIGSSPRRKNLWRAQVGHQEKKEGNIFFVCCGNIKSLQLAVHLTTKPGCWLFFSPTSSCGSLLFQACSWGCCCGASSDNSRFHPNHTHFYAACCCDTHCNDTGCHDQINNSRSRATNPSLLCHQCPPQLNLQMDSMLLRTLSASISWLHQWAIWVTTERQCLLAAAQWCGTGPIDVFYW